MQWKGMQAEIYAKGISEWSNKIYAEMSQDTFFGFPTHTINLFLITKLQALQ